jgi:hypothetical protein
VRYTTIGSAISPTHSSVRQTEQRRQAAPKVTARRSGLLHRLFAGRVWERQRATVSTSPGPSTLRAIEPAPRAAHWRNSRTDEFRFADPKSRRVDQSGPISSRAAHPSAPR